MRTREYFSIIKKYLKKNKYENFHFWSHWGRIYVDLDYVPGRELPNVGAINRLIKSNSYRYCEVAWTSDSIFKALADLVDEKRFRFDHGCHAPLYDKWGEPIVLDNKTSVNGRRMYIMCFMTPEQLIKKAKNKIKQLELKDWSLFINYSTNTSGVGGVLYRDNAAVA